MGKKLKSSERPEPSPLPSDAANQQHSPVAPSTTPVAPFLIDSDAILDTIADGVVIVNDRGEITRVNMACETLFGYHQRDIIGQTIDILLPDPNVSQSPAYDRNHYLETLLRTDDQTLGDNRHDVTGLRKDQTTFPIELVVGQGQSETGRYFIGIMRDVTARMRTETYIRERKQELLAVIETAVDGIIIIDSLGTVRTYNDACETMFGYSKNEVVGNNVKMLMPSPYYDEHDQYLRNYRNTRQKKIIGIGREVTGRRKNGSTFPMELSVGEIAGIDPTLYVGILRDITSRKQIEENLRHSIAAADRASQAKGEFLARVSHELRTPLNAILGFSEMMKCKSLGPLPDRYAEYANDIHGAAMHLHDLVADLLNLSRIEGAGYKLTETETSVTSLIEDAMAYFRSKRNDMENVQFKIDDTSALPQITVDTRMIRQILINLINNALRAIELNGIIEVHARHAANGSIEIAVIDNGCGIDAEQLRTIFEPFAQSKAYVAITRGGSGLGLPISKGLVDMHGGDLWIDTKIGHGTTVSFTIPKDRVIG